MTCTRPRTSTNFGLIGPPNADLDALERLKKIQRLYKGKSDVSTFSQLCLIRSFSYLQVMITYMRACMSFEIGQSRPQVSMVTDRVMMGKNGVSTFSWLFFIRSFSYMQVSKTCMRAQKRSSFSLIEPPTAELAAHEYLKKFP